MTFPIASEQEQRRKDEFLAMLGHESRNPLAPLRTGADLLGRSTDGHGSSKAILPMMDRQLSRLKRLVDDLLNTSRISQGRIQLRRMEFDEQTRGRDSDGRETVLPFAVAR